MSHHHVDSLDKNCWCDVLDYSSLLDDVAPVPAGNIRNPQPQIENVGVEDDVSQSGTRLDGNEFNYLRKRGRSDPVAEMGKKVCRERMRREKLNDRFTELYAVLEPGRPVKTDKLAILGDAIKILNQLKTESLQYKETAKKLLEEIKNLKAEKNELREEKLGLKIDKERIEHQLKMMTVPTTSFIPAHPSAYPNKMSMFPSYGYVPMWQYLPQSTRDTSEDSELRPPAA